MIVLSTSMILGSTAKADKSRGALRSLAASLTDLAHAHWVVAIMQKGQEMKAAKIASRDTRNCQLGQHGSRSAASSRSD